MTTALTVPALFGYGTRQAYAACVNSGGTTYLCSGNETTTQFIGAVDADVSMAAGATVDTSAGSGNAITITGIGDLSFSNTAGGAIAGALDGLNISALNGGGVDTVTVNTTQATSGGRTGISASNAGEGALTINAASATGTSHGVYSQITNASSSAAMTITLSGAATGGARGILSSHQGTGNLTINATSATGGATQGIFSNITNTSSSGTLSITATGTVSGLLRGIETNHQGVGDLTINAASVNSTTFAAIRSEISNAASTGAMSVTTSGAVSSVNNNGFTALQDGRGTLMINAQGDITAASGQGVYARSNNTDAAAMSITTSGMVNAGIRGIYAGQSGGGGVTIKAAAVTGGTSQGIYTHMKKLTATSGLSITSSGAVSGTEGIRARQQGQGAVLINAASATGTNGSGIYALADNSAGTGEVRVTATGTVTGTDRGIDARQDGTGALTINAASASTTAAGNQAVLGLINLASNSAALSITTSGAVSGANMGVTAAHYGRGTVTVNAASANGVSGDGLNVGIQNAASSADMSINATGAISGGRFGILAIQEGSGMTDINIASGASVTGGTGAISTNAGSRLGDDTVTNAGTVTGSIDLAGGTNIFNNQAGGLFNSGAAVVLGAGNTLTNAGTMSPGGKGTIATTTLTGNYVQTAEGILQVDLDPTVPSADLLSVSGTADLAGTVALVLTGDSRMEGQVNVLTAAGGVTDNGFKMASSPTVTYQLVYPDTNSVAVEYVASFARVEAGLAPNQSSLGTYLNQVMEAGSGGLTNLLTSLLGISNNAQYRAALDALMGEHQQNQTGRLFGTNRTFVNNLLSCPERLDGNEKAMADEACVWSRVEGRTTDVDRSSNTVGGDETVWGFSGGYETAIPNEAQVRVGAMLSVEDIQSDSNSGASSDGTRYRVGVKAEKGFGDLELSAGLFGGITNYDTNRPTFGGGGVATSDHDISFASMVGRVSYSWDAGPVRIVPMLDVIATHLDFEEVNEAGAGAANLRIEGNEEWIYSATPALGVVGTVMETDDMKVHASLKGGVSFYSESELTFRSNFLAAPAGVGGFTTTSGFDDVVGNLSGALQFELNEGLSIKAGYDGRFGDLSTSHGGYLRAAMPF